MSADRDTSHGRRIAAAIDVGSNSVHLLVASVDGGRPVELHDESVLLGLGAVVDMEGRIPEVTGRAILAALTDYVAVARDAGAEWVTLLATEPLRRASNRRQFQASVLEATGLPLEVLSHEEEAELTVLSVLGGEPPTRPMLVLDIGGGSSEVVLLGPGVDPVIGVLPVGSARLTAAHIERDPPDRDEIEALRSEAHHLLSGMPAGHPQQGTVVGGSGTNLVRMTSDGARSDQVIDKERIAEALTKVTTYPSTELMEMYGLRERRVVQMAAGASLIEATLDCYGLERMDASDRSLREGAILAWARAGDGWREQLSELVSGPASADGAA